MNEIDEIVGLISGNITEDQKDTVLEKVKNNAQLHKEYNVIKNAWALSSSKIEMSELKIERSYLSLKSKMKNGRSSNTLQFFSLLKYAAVLLIFFGSGYFLNHYISDSANDEQMSGVGLTEFSVPMGQLAEVNLPDGSHVWLNSDTKLLFSNNFHNKTRQVTLEGEAYFKVQKGETPFVVSTKHGEIEVLGTSFNVRAYEDIEFQTTLIDGTVTYKNIEQNKEFTLSPGQQVVLIDNEVIKILEVDTNVFTSWKEGIIIFDKEPLCDVVKKLERHFDVQISLEDSKLREMRFTGKIENESLFEVMEYINKTKPINYTYNKNLKILIVKPK